MAKNDWDLDDLLDFHFDRGVPEENKEIDLDKERKLYEELRKESKDSSSPSFDASEQRSGTSSASSRRSGSSKAAPEPRRSSSGASEQLRSHKWIDDSGDALAAPIEEVDDSHPGLKEIEAIKQASQEAYDRYRSNYTKNKKRREGGGRIKSTKSQKILSIVYIASLALFALSMLFMNVLPMVFYAIIFGILLLISLVLFIETRRRGIPNWRKWVATIVTLVLIVVYGVGSVYALGTLTFLHGNSVNNANAVADVTRNPFTFIITGIDVDGTIDAEGRSDVNMVVTINPKTHQILMTSIPRDYEVYMPDYDNAMDKLTHTGFYGVQTTIGAEEQLLDTTVNYYVKVNFTTVERFIDAIGGIDVESEYEFTPVKLKSWTVQKGMNHMNGKQALAFARERKAFPAGDNQRIKNQQLVFEALIKKATSSRTMLLSYSKVLSSLNNYFEMSFSSRETRKLVKYQIAKDPNWKIFKNTIVGGDGMLPTYSTGGEYAYVMTQDEYSIENAKTLINAVLEGQDLQTDENGVVTVTPGN